MGVLVKKNDFNGPIEGKLSTKFVFDWRVKDFKEDINGTTVTRKRWMRRARFVAREFAFCQKRFDTYSPATSTNILNLLPLIYLKQRAEADGMADYKPVLGCLDVKDAFLMVSQERAIELELFGESLVIVKNLPGQRLGAKAWYWHLRNFLSSTFGEDPRQCHYGARGRHHVHGLQGFLG